MGSIKLEWLFYAEPSKVFEALTNEKVISQWSGEEAVVELKKGGKMEMFGGWVKGEVLDFENGKFLSYSWKPVDWDKNAQPSKVCYQIEQLNNVTKVVLQHDEFPNEDEAGKHKDGWINHVFDPLSNYLVEQI